jgi:hypothetical protein
MVLLSGRLLGGSGGKGVGLCLASASLPSSNGRRNRSPIDGRSVFSPTSFFAQRNATQRQHDTHTHTPTSRATDEFTMPDRTRNLIEVSHVMYLSILFIHPLGKNNNNAFLIHDDIPHPLPSHPSFDNTPPSRFPHQPEHTHTTTGHRERADGEDPAGRAGHERHRPPGPLRHEHQGPPLPISHPSIRPSIRPSIHPPIHPSMETSARSPLPYIPLSLARPPSPLQHPSDPAS